MKEQKEMTHTEKAGGITCQPTVRTAQEDCHKLQSSGEVGGGEGGILALNCANPSNSLLDSCAKQTRHEDHQCQPQADRFWRVHI